MPTKNAWQICLASKSHFVILINSISKKNKLKFMKYLLLDFSPILYYDHSW